MEITSESAKLFTSEPFSGGNTVKGATIDIGQQPSREEHTTTDEAESLDDHVSVLILFVLGEGSVDDVAEIRLKANVEETEDGEDLVDNGITDGGINVGSNEEILDSLQEFHGEEEKDTSSEASVVGLGPDPPGGEQADTGESSRHFHRETHDLDQEYLFYTVTDVRF